MPNNKMEYLKDFIEDLIKPVAGNYKFSDVWDMEKIDQNYITVDINETNSVKFTHEGKFTGIGKEETCEFRIIAQQKTNAKTIGEKEQLVFKMIKDLEEPFLPYIIGGLSAIPTPYVEKKKDGSNYYRLQITNVDISKIVPFAPLTACYMDGTISYNISRII